MEDTKIFGVIYIITNKVSGTQYVGQTTQTMKQRFSNHKTAGRKHKLKTVLCNAMYSYGVDNFMCEEVQTAYSRLELDLAEKDAIVYYNTLFPNGYNLTTGGYGFNHIQETKDRLSSMFKGKEGYWKDKQLTEEHKKNLSLAKMGYKWSDEAIQSRSEGIKTFYTNLRNNDPDSYEKYISSRRNPSHLHTPEAREKARLGKIGTHPLYSEERNKKISLTLKSNGHKPSEECTIKANEARRGTHHSEESKQKMSEALKGKEPHNKFIPTEEQKELILEMLSSNKSPREISIILFGEYRKTLIYRVVKDLGYVTSPDSGVEEQTVRVTCRFCGKEFEDYASNKRNFCSKSCRAKDIYKKRKNIQST